MSRSIEVLEWGEIENASLVINTTSLGLKENDNIELNFKNIKIRKVVCFMS